MKTNRECAEWGLGITVLLVFVAAGHRVFPNILLPGSLGTLRAMVRFHSLEGLASDAVSANFLFRLLLIAAPSLVLLSRLPMRRVLWVAPPLGFLFFLCALFALAYGGSVESWLLLVAASAAGVTLCRYRFLGWTVLLPLLLVSRIVLRHGALMFGDVGTEDAEIREQLFRSCMARRGEVAINLTPDLIMPYHSINRYREDLWLLTSLGEHDGGMRGLTGGRRVGSWWMRRKDGRFEFEFPSAASGNLWRGCHMGQTLWFSRANRLVKIDRVSDDPQHYEQVAMPALESDEPDFGEAACFPELDRFYVGEGLSGGLWRLEATSWRHERRQLDGLAMLPMRRGDGKLVVTTHHSIYVIDPATDEIKEQFPSALVSHGHDLCSTNHSIAVADMAGRLRVFEIGAEGRYQLAWGISLFAPRRVAYSPDCSRLMVTSAGDDRVYLIDAAKHELIDTFEGGPALRDVVATGEREFSYSDVCGVTTIRW